MNTKLFVSITLLTNDEGPLGAFESVVGVPELEKIETPDVNHLSHFASHSSPCSASFRSGHDTSNPASQVRFLLSACDDKRNNETQPII